MARQPHCGINFAKMTSSNLRNRAAWKIAMQKTRQHEKNNPRLRHTYAAWRRVSANSEMKRTRGEALPRIKRISSRPFSTSLTTLLFRKHLFAARASLKVKWRATGITSASTSAPLEAKYMEKKKNIITSIDIEKRDGAGIQRLYREGRTLLLAEKSPRNRWRKRKKGRLPALVARLEWRRGKKGIARNEENIRRKKMALFNKENEKSTALKASCRRAALPRIEKGAKMTRAALHKKNNRRAENLSMEGNATL